MPILGRLLLLRAYTSAPITCQYSGAYGITIRGLGGKTCHCTGWEYRDIGRLFITVGGEESDNRGAEVGLGGGDSPGQSGGHSPQTPATPLRPLVMLTTGRSRWAIFDRESFIGDELQGF